jgi:hypothetical protein
MLAGRVCLGLSALRRLSGSERFVGLVGLLRKRRRRLSTTDSFVLEGIDGCLEDLHVDVVDVEIAILADLELCGPDLEAEPDYLRDLGAALESLDELKTAIREMRACAAAIALRV